MALTDEITLAVLDSFFLDVVDGDLLHLFFKDRKMKALLGLVIFVLLPLAPVFWVYLLSRKRAPMNLPVGKTDLISILRAYHKANGKRSLPIIVSIGLFWLSAVLIRLF